MDHPRRSKTSLKHLSLSPLTTAYPLLPTSPSPPLQTSTSYSYLASPTYPSTPTVLSRSSSRTRLRSNHASPQPIMTSTSSPALPKASGRPAHHKRASANAIPTSASLISSAVTSPAARIDEENSWLLRTASTLQLQRMEEKGHAWLATRNSSTSLTNTGADDMADDELSPYVTTSTQAHSADWPRSPIVTRSRVGSRYASHVPSRLGSRVQSRAGSGANLRDDGLKALTRATDDKFMAEEDMVGPDFVDPSAFEEEEMVEDEDVDESEMRRVIMGRAKGWVDWAVGWMDLRGEEETWEVGEDDADDDRDSGLKLEENIARRRRRQPRPGNPADREDSGEKVALPPQDQDAGGLADVKWLLAVASKLIV